MTKFIENRFVSNPPFVTAFVNRDYAGTLPIFVVPLARFGQPSLNLADDSAQSTIHNLLSPLGGAFKEYMFNHHGMIQFNRYEENKSVMLSHVQAFRDWSVEYCTNLFTKFNNSGERIAVAGMQVENNVIGNIKDVFRLYQEKGIVTPYLIQFGLNCLSNLQLHRSMTTNDLNVPHNFSTHRILLAR